MATTGSLEEMNAAAQQVYEDQVMVGCPGCGRTFSGQDRLDVHMRGCKDVKNGPARGSGPGMSGSSPKGASTPSDVKGAYALAEKPKMLLCYICGKEFGSKSLAIHEPQCAAKFEAEQALLPEGQRKGLPSRPSVAGTSLEERNAAAQQVYEAQVMVGCPGCGRTFSGQDRLDVHMRGCKESKGGAQAARV